MSAKGTIFGLTTLLAVGGTLTVSEDARNLTSEFAEKTLCMVNDYNAWQRCSKAVDAYYDEANNVVYVNNSNASREDIEALGDYGKAADHYIKHFTNGGLSLREDMLPPLENSFVPAPDLTDPSITDEEIKRFVYTNTPDEQIKLLRLAAIEFARLDRPENYMHAQENRVVALAEQMAETDGRKRLVHVNHTNAQNNSNSGTEMVLIPES